MSMYKTGVMDHNNSLLVNDRYVRVVYDFEPSLSGDLLLSVGDVIKVDHQVDKLWYSGQKIGDNSSGLKWVFVCCQVDVAKFFCIK